MVKVVTAQEMARLESWAYTQGESELGFMRHAGEGIANQAEHLLIGAKKQGILILCGGGNNGGDGYVAALLLHQRGYSVQAVAVGARNSNRPLCQDMCRQFEQAGGELLSSDCMLPVQNVGLIIDALFGTGFHGPMAEPYATCIQQANASAIPILSIDIPSGIQGTTGEVAEVSVHAHTTVCLGFPKWGMLSKAAWNLVGRTAVHDFGIGPYATQAHEKGIWLEDAYMRTILPHIVRCRHKYEAGSVVGIGGSSAFSGAPILSSWAALKAGAGLVTLWHPKEMVLHHVPLELIHHGFDKAAEVMIDPRRTHALFMGPGWAGDSRDLDLLHQICSQYSGPLILDAGALSLFGRHAVSPRSESILTPHEGEMARLLGLSQVPERFDLLERTQAYAQTHQVYILLKGAPTFLIHPKLPPHICPVGDPGMATAGMGDVLTGIVASLCAQGCTPWNACLLGAYLHGLAGELAAKKETSYGLMAHDVITALPQAFQRLCSDD